MKKINYERAIDAIIQYFYELSNESLDSVGELRPRLLAWKIEAIVENERQIAEKSAKKSRVRRARTRKRRLRSA